MYVAITRPKQQLSIHYNQSYFQEPDDDNINYITDSNTYPEPGELLLTLSHRDVYLNSFSWDTAQHIIEQLLPGMAIGVLPDGTGMLYQGNRIGSFSKGFKDKIEMYLNRGYKLSAATIRFIAYWKTEDGRELQIILPEITLRK